MINVAEEREEITKFDFEERIYCEKLLNEIETNKFLLEHGVEALISKLQAEKDQAVKFLEEVLPHIECANHFQNGLITAIGTFLQALEGG